LNGVLQEESVQDLEIGWRYKSSNWKINANLFHMGFNNEISQVGALVEQSYMEIRQNVPHSQRCGVELALGFEPSQKVAVLLNGAFMQTNVEIFENGQEVFKDVSHIFAPKWVIYPQINVMVSEQLGLSLSGRHVSSSFMELANISSFALPSHTVLNTSVDIAFNEKASMSLQLNNIFNQQYFTDGAPVDLDYDGIVEGPGFRIQPPRHFYLMFTLSL
jgi:iron complex outermembrane receptor protein